MLKSLMQVSGFTAISRLLGFLRDILIARYLGSGLLGDAFFSAFRFPNLFRRIFGEGAFNAAFVPMFGRRLEKDGQEEAMKFASNAFSVLLIMLIIVTAIGIPLMPQIMSVVVPGFKSKVEINLSESASRESFSMRVDKKRDVYLQLPKAYAGEDKAMFQFENVHFTEEEPGKIFRFIGAGERGGRWEIEQVAHAYDREEVKRADRQNRDPHLSIENFKSNAGVWKITGDGLARLRLPKGHGLGWFEGELVRLSNVKGAEGEFKMYRNHPETFALTVKLSQITFCYLLFMALVAHLSGVLNTFRIFGVPAAAPILLNLVFLIGLGVFVALMKSDIPAHVCAWCVAVAGVLQFMMLYGACRKNGYHVRVHKPVFDSSIKRLFLLMGPGILAAGIQQINLLVGSIIASFQQGAISWLYYSDRVYQLPLGMIGIALGVVLLPEVTRLLRRDDPQGASDSMVRGMELGLLITLPAAAAMIVMPVPIISVLFQRGEFTPDDALQAGLALRGFALGLPGYVLIKVLQPGYFARENTKSPMLMAGVTVLVNIVVSLLLFHSMGHVGIAIATTIAAWVNVILLARGLKGLVHPTKKFWSRCLRIVIASIVMGLIVSFGNNLLASWFDAVFWKRCAALAGLITLGMGTYTVLVLGLKATSIAELKAGFKRG